MVKKTSKMGAKTRRKRSMKVLRIKPKGKQFRVGGGRPVDQEKRKVGPFGVWSKTQVKLKKQRKMVQNPLKDVSDKMKKAILSAGRL